MGKERIKVAVLGAAGMLGHMLSQCLAESSRFSLRAYARKESGLSKIDSALVPCDLADWATLKASLLIEKPDVIVNCAASLNESDAIAVQRSINSELPLKLAAFIDAHLPSSRLIQISSDGVFSGARGMYTEEDPPDASDSYGVQKRKGEVIHTPHCTVRTSIIGPELTPRPALFEWICAATGSVQGYTNVFWSGVTTLELSRVLLALMDQHISGIVHIYSERVSKFELLSAIKEIFDLNVSILKAQGTPTDRSLRSVRTDFLYSVPTLREMLTTLKRKIK